jgi:hypothetical protein
LEGILLKKKGGVSGRTTSTTLFLNEYLILHLF